MSHEEIVRQLIAESISETRNETASEANLRSESLHNPDIEANSGSGGETVASKQELKSLHECVIQFESKAGDSGQGVSE